MTDTTFDTLPSESALTSTSPVVAAITVPGNTPARTPVSLTWETTNRYLTDRGRNRSTANKKQYRVRLYVPFCMNLMVGPHNVGRGVSEVLLYEDEIDNVRKNLLASPEQIERAKEAQDSFVEVVAEAVLAQLNDGPNSPWSNVSVATIKALLLSPELERRPEVLAIARKIVTTRGEFSVPGEYHKATKKDERKAGLADMRPIERMEVLDEVEPQLTPDAEQQRMLAEQHARGIAQIVSSANQASLTELVKVLGEALGPSLANALKEAGLAGKGK